MKDMIASNGGIVGVVVLLSMALNVMLSALKSVLQMFIKDPAAQAADEKIKFIDKVLALLAKVVDFLSANVEHK